MSSEGARLCAAAQRVPEEEMRQRRWRVPGRTPSGGVLWVVLGGISALWTPRAVLRGAPA